MVSFERKTSANSGGHDAEIPLLKLCGPKLEYHMMKERRPLRPFDNVSAFMGFITSNATIDATPADTLFDHRDIYHSIVLPSLHPLRSEKSIGSQRRHLQHERQRQRESRRWFPTTKSDAVRMQSESWSTSLHSLKCTFYPSDEAYRTMFMYRLPKSITESRLHAEIMRNTQLEPYSIQRIVIIHDRLSGKPRGYCFVVFAKRVHMVESIRILKRMQLDNHKVGIDVRRGGVECDSVDQDVKVYRKIPQRLLNAEERELADRHPSRKRPWPSP